MQRQEIPEEKEHIQGKMSETIQRQELEEDEKLQMKSVMQRKEIPEEDEPLQEKMIGTVQRQEIPEEEEFLQKKSENNTGMPDNLKTGVENLSGIDISDVRVNYNSSKPAELGALAYTQGTNIHIAPGQERHLPHEAWHVVQQVQGRVKPTMQMKFWISVNDDKGLEHEADVLGEKSKQITHQVEKCGTAKSELKKEHKPVQNVGKIIQRLSKEDMAIILEEMKARNIPLEQVEDFMKDLKETPFEIGFGYVNNQLRNTAIGTSATSSKVASVKLSDLSQGLTAEEKKNLVLTHFHPQGLPLSNQDVAKAIGYNYKEVHAVGKHGVFSYKRSEDFWGLRDVFKELPENLHIDEKDKEKEQKIELNNFLYVNSLIDQIDPHEITESEIFEFFRKKEIHDYKNPIMIKWLNKESFIFRFISQHYILLHVKNYYPAIKANYSYPDINKIMEDIFKEEPSQLEKSSIK